MTPGRALLALVLAITPAKAQQSDSRIVETPSRRLALTAGDLTQTPHDTATVSFHEGPAHLYRGIPLHAVLEQSGVRGAPLSDAERPFRLLLVGDPRHSRWTRQVIAIRVRAEH